MLPFDNGKETNFCIKWYSLEESLYNCSLLLTNAENFENVELEQRM